LTDQPSETGHLTPEQLDELTLVPAPQPLLERHLAGCATCRSALAEQVAVRRMLQRVPDPGPMPADLVARLDSALAGARSPGTTPATVLPMRAREERTGLLGRLAESRVTKSLVAAAAVALIGVGGYAAIQRGPSSSGGASAGRASDASGGGAAAQPQAASRLDQVHPQASGTDYTKANLVGLLRQRLAEKELAPAGNGFEGTPPAPSTPTSTATAKATGRPAGPLTTTAGLRACLDGLGVPGVVPLYVDLATFEGKPAAVVVLPAGNGAEVAWVVSRTCAPGNDGTLYYAALK
jgi:hypothetical protein